MRRNFVRKKEDFVCDVCGAKVTGDGYTDHCDVCLWGKHVDMDLPGDRASDCGGLMEPMGVVQEKGDFRIDYRCEKCGHKFRVRRGKNDDMDKLVELVAGNNRG